MKLLMYSTDRSLFDADSPVRMRLQEQADLVTSLDVIVFTPVADKYKEFKLGRKLTVHPTASSSKFSYLPDAYRIGKNILTGAADTGKWLITTQDPFLTGVIGYMLSRKFKVPLHLQLHTDPWSREWRGERLRNTFEFLIARFLLSRAQGVRVVSQRVRTAVLSLGVTPDKITRVPIWVDTAMFRDGVPNFDLHHTYPAFSRIILSIGRLQPEKNYGKLIKTFAHLARIHDDVILLIVGSGPERERLTTLARTLGVEKSVVILPWARDVVSYYKTSDIYVQPSLYEGWGLAVIEAMSSGLPVVMTDVGCAGEVIRDEETGLVVPVGSEDALLSALTRLLEDNSLRVTLAENGKEESKKLATKEDTLRLYKESWQKAYGKVEPERIRKAKTPERGTKTKKKS
jgi:glycosyltransferase involved in cell wall biosynthesis